jgi:DNA-binding NarL/FixJ family response regulator
MSKINILIVDDHKLIRETWSYILNSDSRFQVIAECGDAQEAVELAKTKRPHVVLMDINMAPFSGLEATQRIRKISPGSKVIGVSMHSQPAYAKKMLQMGARGYVTKNSSKEEMIKAILEVNHGNKYHFRATARRKRRLAEYQCPDGKRDADHQLHQGRIVIERDRHQPQYLA